MSDNRLPSHLGSGPSSGSCTSGLRTAPRLLSLFEHEALELAKDVGDLALQAGRSVCARVSTVRGRVSTRPPPSRTGGAPLRSLQADVAGKTPPADGRGEGHVTPPALEAIRTAVAQREASERSVSSARGS